MSTNIETRFEQEVNSERTINNLLSEGKIAFLKNACDILWYKYEIFIVFSLINSEYEKSKRYNVIASLLDIYRVKNYNDRLLDYGLNHIGYSILSDNEKLIQEYSKLRYNKGDNAELSMEEMVLQGESVIWSNTIQFFMSNDIQGIERNLNIIETKALQKLPKNQQELKIDYEFYKALLSKDKSKCEELLEQLVSPKIHKKRNDNTILNKYVSQPALGYAKLAWRQGLEVEVDSPLIPKEILPIKPLYNYEIPYESLR